MRVRVTFKEFTLTNPPQDRKPAQFEGELLTFESISPPMQEPCQVHTCPVCHSGVVQRVNLPEGAVWNCSNCGSTVPYKTMKAEYNAKLYRDSLRCICPVHQHE